MVKSANDTPRYAVILEFYTKKYPAGYTSDMVRIVNDVNNNQGLTYADRLLHVTEDQVPIDVATKLFAKYKSFKETGHIRS